MPNKHKLGAYIAPAHDQKAWQGYLSAIDPGFIRVLMSGDSPTTQISDVHRICPEAYISLRWWDLDDGGDGEKRKRILNPGPSAERDIAEMVRRYEVMEREAWVNELPFPGRDQVYFNAVNEPPTWEHELRPNIVESNVVGAKLCEVHGFGYLFLEMAVGHPEEWPPVWDWAMPLLNMIREGYGELALHEYWQPEGPFYQWTDDQGNSRDDWGALAGRFLKLPFPVSTVITETGVEGVIYDRHKKPDTGYKKFMQPEAYAAQIGMYLQRLKEYPWIISALPFITDFQDKEWASFDTLYAQEALVKMLRALDGKPPIVVGPPPPVVTPPSTGDMVSVPRLDYESIVELAVELADRLKEYES